MKIYQRSKLVLGFAIIMAGMSLLRGEPSEDAKSVSLITSDGQPVPFWSRLDAVHALSRNIADGERAKLFTFLLSTEIPKGLQSHHVWVLKNDLLNTLRNQDLPTQEYQSVLQNIAENPQQDEVIRDYAVQHARPWYSKSENKPAILDLLWKIARNSKSSLSGTALLSIWGIYEEFPKDVDATKLLRASLALAKNSEASMESRISSLQICGRMGYGEALSLARELANNGESERLRMAAIATIGDLGSRKDSHLLELIETSNGKNSGILKAVKTARKKIQSK
jgi:hypothetical protein